MRKPRWFFLLPGLLLFVTLLFTSVHGTGAQSTTPPFRLYLSYLSQQPAPTPPPPPPNTPPLPTTSYYMKTLDPKVSYQLGCELGLRDLNTPGKQESLVFLAYGYPQGYADGTYGASLFGFGPAPTDQIAISAREFGYGYWWCVGTDFDSTLKIGIGTNNFTGAVRPSVTYNHGRAWAQMSLSVNEWLRNVCPRGCDGQVEAFGANDIELGFNYPTPSINWVNGYMSVANHRPLLNFGAIPGCPWLGRPITQQCGTASYLWSKSEVLQVTAHNSIINVPEIYATSGVNAEQWYVLSVYSYNNLGKPLKFIGTLTTYQACQQRSGCTGIDNTPQQGWNQLNRLVNGDVRTYQRLTYSSDIKWYGERDTVLPLSVAGLQQSSAPEKEAVKLPVDFDQAEPPAFYFATGIIDGGEGLVSASEAEITNLWQGVTSEGFVQVLAGVSTEEEGQGVVFVMETDPTLSESQIHSYFAPDGAGKLEIIAAEEGRLRLRGASGAEFWFDLAQGTFQQ
jgi:hypothetical protein